MPIIIFIWAFVALFPLFVLFWVLYTLDRIRKSQGNAVLFLAKISKSQEDVAFLLAKTNMLLEDAASTPVKTPPTPIDPATIGQATRAR